MLDQSEQIILLACRLQLAFVYPCFIIGLPKKHTQGAANMLKKFIKISTLFIIATGIAAAYTAPYLGASLGVVNNSENKSGNGVTGTFGSYRGVPVNVFFGYGGLLGQTAYLAGEFGATAGTANISNNDDLKSSYGFNAGILPGIMLNDMTMAYARVGFVYSRFPNAANNSTWRSGGQFGLGLQTSVSQNIDVRGEYDFVAYESKNETASGVTYSVAPRSDQVNFGLVYKFD